MAGCVIQGMTNPVRRAGCAIQQAGHPACF
jgi:hypothetical protein